eukprot:15484288-Alexandrium_andersonii.AAC.1
MIHVSGHSEACFQTAQGIQKLVFRVLRHPWNCMIPNAGHQSSVGHPPMGQLGLAEAEKRGPKHH